MLARRVVARYKRAGFIPDKFWKDALREFKVILLTPMDDARDVSYTIEGRLLNFLSLFHDQLEGFGMNRHALATLKMRVDALRHTFEQVGGPHLEDGLEKPVTPVSDYGASSIEEAFAEAFERYVLERDMDRDQLESFKQVLKMANRVAHRYARSIRLDKSGIREFSRTVEKEFLRHLSGKSGPLGNRIVGQWPFMIRAVDGVPLTVYVRLEAQETDDFKYVLSGGLGFLKGQPVVVIHVNGSLEASVLEKGAESHLFSSELYPVLLHELTHAADKYTPGVAERGDVSEEDLQNNPALYYNDRSEVRAYMQEVVDEVSQHFKNWPKLQRAMGQKAFRTLLNLSRTWQKVSPYWTPRNQQQVIKAVAQELNDWEAQHG